MKIPAGENRMGRHGAADGFTLIELLVVIAMIAVLLAILIAAVGPMREKTRAAATKSRMATIATGLDQYKIDHGFFPPSAPAGGPSSNASATFKGGTVVNSGSAMLAEAMLGYLDGAKDGAGSGFTPNPDPTEFGFRTHVNSNGTPTGRLYGPYTDANSSVKLAAGIYGTIRVDSATRMVYLDGYGREILYYRAYDRLSASLPAPTSIFGANNSAVFNNNDNYNVSNVMFDPAATATTVFFKNLSNGGGSNVDKPSMSLGRDAYLMVSSHRDTIFFNDDDVIYPTR